MNTTQSKSIFSAEALSTWPTVKFGEVVENVNLVERNLTTAGIERIVGLEHIDPENLHIRRWDSIDDGTHSLANLCSDSRFLVSAEPYAQSAISPYLCAFRRNPPFSTPTDPLSRVRVLARLLPVKPPNHRHLRDLASHSAA